MKKALVAAGVLVAAAAAVPVVAFGVVPLFVRSTLNEPALATPSPSATADSPSPSAAPTPASRVLTGELRRIDAVHYGSGRVTISGPVGSQVLRFEQVAIAGAPNMFVYLSDRSDGQPGTYTDLGPLKATNGSFNYELPAGLDLSAVHSVVVWCRAFSVTVTYAPLGEAPG